MLLLRMFGMELSEQETEKLDSLFSELATQLRPFVAPTLAAQAEVFGLKSSSIQPSRSSRVAPFEQGSVPVKGELYRRQDTDCSLIE
jgi:hypothetical protein